MKDPAIRPASLNFLSCSIGACCQRRQNAGGQQVDGIPNASLCDQTKEHRHNRHGDGAGKSAVKTRPIRMHLHGDPDAVAADAGRQVIHG